MFLKLRVFKWAYHDNFQSSKLYWQWTQNYQESLLIRRRTFSTPYILLVQDLSLDVGWVFGHLPSSIMWVPGACSPIPVTSTHCVNPHHMVHTMLDIEGSTHHPNQTNMTMLASGTLACSNWSHASSSFFKFKINKANMILETFAKIMKKNETTNITTSTIVCKIVWTHALPILCTHT